MPCGRITSTGCIRSTRTRVKVTDGMFTLEAENYFVSAVVLVPASAKDDFDKFADSARKLRIEAFEKTLRPLPGKKPRAQTGDGPFVLYEPAFGAEVQPWTGPTAEERKHTALKTAAAPGQTVTLRLAVTPFADLGRCMLETSALKGPSEIAADRIAVYSQNYRYDGDSLSEMALMPSPTLDVERGVTECFWLTLDVPETGGTGDVPRGRDFPARRGRRRAPAGGVGGLPFRAGAGVARLVRHVLHAARRAGIGGGGATPAGEGTISVDAQDRFYRHSGRARPR